MLLRLHLRAVINHTNSSSDVPRTSIHSTAFSRSATLQNTHKVEQHIGTYGERGVAHHRLLPAGGVASHCAYKQTYECDMFSSFRGLGADDERGKWKINIPLGWRDTQLQEKTPKTGDDLTKVLTPQLYQIGAKRTILAVHTSSRRRRAAAE